MPMLMALFLFCNRSLHALELPYGPVSLTLLDIVAIIGLKPLGKTYALGLFKDQIERAEIDIDFSDKSCGDFIEKNVRNTKQISNVEYIAFFMYWVSSHLSCTRSLQIPMYSYNLAQALHFGDNICLRKFFLASIYKFMEEAVEILDTPGKMKPIAGPLWIMCR